MVLRRTLMVLALAPLGCASTVHTVLPPESGGDGGEGPLVHVQSDDPSQPLALYRVEHVLHDQWYASRIRRGPRSDTSDEVREQTTSVDRLLCLAPCDQRLPGVQGGRFLLGGEGLSPSSTFVLDPSAKSLTIKASPGSRLRSLLGEGVLITGGASLFLSILTLPPGVLNHDAKTTGAGVGLLSAGVILIGAGIPLVLTGRTTYSIAQQGPVLRF